MLRLNPASWCKSHVGGADADAEADPCMGHDSKWNLSGEGERFPASCHDPGDPSRTVGALHALLVLARKDAYSRRVGSP